MHENYNIIGLGVIKPKLFGAAAQLYEELKHYKFNEKIYENKQLGSIRHFLKGAHYTKYEYMILQIKFINQFKQRKGSGLSKNYYSQTLSYKGGEITNEVVLQCLSILTNVAHLPDTYTASKHWFYKLKSNTKKSRSMYRSGLSEKQKVLLDKLLKNNKYHDIHIMNMIYLLRRSRKKHPIIKFSEWLLYNYLTREDKKLNEILPFFESARKISYLILDSYYAPIPIKIEYQQMINLFDENFDINLIKDRNSTFQQSLNLIAELLQSTLYLSAETLLYKSKISIDMESRFLKNVTEDIESTDDLKGILNTQLKNNSLSDVYGNKESIYYKTWNDNILLLEYKLNREFLDKSLNIKVFEERVKSKVGLQTGLFNIELTPNHKNLYMVCALNKKYKNKINKAFQLVQEFININNELENHGYSLDNKNHSSLEESLMKYVLQFSFTKDERIDVIFDPERIKGDIFNSGNGKVEVIQKINETLEKNKDILNKDEAHEIKTTLEYLKNIDYKGLFIVYIGSTIIQGENGKMAEFDGVILTPNNENEKLYIIEAKNGRRNASMGQEQLEERLRDNLNQDLSFIAKRYKRRDAVAIVSIKE